MQKVAKAIKIIFYTLIFTVCGAMIFRSCIMFDYYPAKMRRVLWTPAAAAVYEQNGRKAFGAQKQDLNYSYDDPKEGNFFASHLIRIPAAEEVQVTVRYNISTLTRYAQRYDRAEEEISFAFFLSDNEGRHYPLTASDTDEAFHRYHYLRLAFDGVDCDAVTHLYLDIYFTDAVNLEEQPLASILIYENDLKWKPYRLARAEHP